MSNKMLADAIQSGELALIFCHPEGLGAIEASQEQRDLIVAALTKEEQLYERINCLEDSLGTVLSYLEGDPQYANAKPGLLIELNALLADTGSVT